MNETQSHRGPDYAGVFADDSIVLGHRLLAIREDTRLSKQPRHNKRSPWVLLLNGQIYNTNQLKKELPAAYQDTNLDTTILYAVIEKYGWDFIYKIQGMYAIALYNSVENIVRLYRDPSGQKVLYYYCKGKEFVFSSEIRGILAHGNHIDRQVDYDAIAIGAALGFIPGTKTLCKHIQKVDASEIITYNIADHSVHKDFFASSSPASYYPQSFDDTLSQLLSEHLQSKPQVAINLSGGLDSALILHEMSKRDYPLHSYTTRFDTDIEKYNTDAHLAARLAKDYGALHHDILIGKKEYMDNFYESYKAVEEPRQNISLPIYLALAKQEGSSGENQRVVLSGDGGDEVFGGYSHYRRYARDEKLLQWYPTVFFNLIRNMRNDGPNLQYQDPWDRWYFHRYYKYTKKSFLSDATSFKDVADYLNRHSATYMNAYRTKNDPFNDCMLMDRIMWLAGENFIRSDKIFMSQSIEVRNPLSYHPFRTHMDALIPHDGYMNQTTNKIFLRNWAQQNLPHYITARTDKAGWRAPVASWYDENMKHHYLNIIKQAQKNNSDFIDWGRIATHIEGTDNWPGRNTLFFISLAIVSESLTIKI